MGASLSLFFTEIPGDSIISLLTRAAGADVVVQMETEEILHVTRPRRVDSDIPHSLAVC